MIASSKEQAFFADLIETGHLTLNLFRASASHADLSLFLDLNTANKASHFGFFRNERFVFNCLIV